ncbi:MAG: hypothetical protein VCD33_08515 [Alphaproteobacteria bacterium]
MAAVSDPAALVDVARYPITELESSAGARLIAHCHKQLAHDGALSLPGFIRPEMIEPLAAEARTLAPLAYQNGKDHTCYFEPEDDGFPDGHPRRRLLHTSQGGVASDHIGDGTMLRCLYQWDALMTFIGIALGEPTLYRHADTFAALNINVFDSGQGLNWHFDRTDFSVTLSLQAASAGGTFEYAPMLRRPDDENYQGVSRVLTGVRKGLRRLSFPPGTLAVFQGYNSLHRVTPVRGSRARLAAVLSFVREPGVRFTPYAQNLFYGRTDGAAG